MTLTLVILACATLAWWSSGKLFAPTSVGTGPCRDCGRLSPLYRFARSHLCRACFDKIDGMIP